MAAPRERIPVFVLDTAGAPRVGASAHIKRRSTGSTVTVYDTETGAGTLTNPGQVIAGADGRLAGWVSRNDLVATVTGGGLGAPKDYEFDAYPARGAERSATKPTAPVDGQEWIYSPATGIDWRFVYDSASSFWRFQGGGFWTAKDPATVSTTSATWSALSGSPSLTMPFAGVYNVEHGFGGLLGSPVVGNRGQQDVYLNGVALGSGSIASVSTIDLTTVNQVTEMTVGGAAQLVQLRQSSQGAGTLASFYARWLRVLPVRLNV